MAVGARLTVFQILDMSDNWQTIQCDFKQFNYRGEITISEDETFCEVQKDVSSPNNSFSGNGVLNLDTDKAFRVFRAIQKAGVARPFRYGPGGSDTGDFGISGNAFLGTVEIQATAGQNVQITFEGAVDGDDFDFTWPA
jgi:hypothetical protein